MRLTKLEPMQQGGYILHFDDASSVKTTTDLVARLGLYSGMELTEQQGAELLNTLAEARARQRAMAMVGRRALSKKELIKKLREKGETPEHSQAAADRLEDLGYINDREYALYLTQKLGAKGYGPARIKNELYSRGIDREYWDEALEGLSSPEEKLDSFIQKKLSGLRPDDKQLKKVTDALYRRGYAWDDVRSAVARYMRRFDEDYYPDTDY